MSEATPPHNDTDFAVEPALVPDAAAAAGPATSSPSALVPTSWEQVSLHAWATIAVLYGGSRPTVPNDRTPDWPEDERRAYMRSALSLGQHGGRREITDVMGGQVVLNERLVNKIAGQPDRTPYVPWAAFGPQLAAEVWRKATTSKATGKLEVRDYYLVPISDLKDHEGFVVIVGEDRVVFNVYPVRSTTSDSLRNGACIFRGYPESVRCSVECCENLLKARREAGLLRNELAKVRAQMCTYKELSARLGKENERLRSFLER